MEGERNAAQAARRRKRQKPPNGTMATGIAVGQANLILDALCRSVAYDVTAFFLKLHLGDPGSAGTTSPAAHTTALPQPSPQPPWVRSPTALPSHGQA